MLPPPAPPRAHRLRRTVLAGATVAVLASPVVPAAPAAAQPTCGPSGDVTLEGTPWPVRRLDLPSTWPMTRGQDVTVAVIDSGVSATHPSLQGRVLPGRDFGQPASSGQCDEAGHGTLVASIIAGRDDTDAPFVGVAPHAEILPARVLEDIGRVTDPELPGNVAQAIVWAVDNGAQVINLSLETVPTEQLAAAVVYARDNDVVMVAAAGNLEEGETRGPAFPGAYQEVMAVAGVDESGGHVDSSVSGEYISVAAPGHDIEGPAPAGGFLAEPDGGTSYSTAYVSGVVALVRSYHPQLRAGEVMRRIEATADHPPAGRNGLVGYGVVNPYRALSTVLGTRTNPPAAPVQPSAVQADPLADEKGVATAAAASGGVLAVLLLLGRALVRKGQRRGWRPSRPAVATPAVATRVDPLAGPGTEEPGHWAG